MSYTDVGKDAKRMGRVHPRNARKADPVPERATPAAKPHRKVEKPFGISYESRLWWRAGKPWKLHHEWFKTARSRDQSMKVWARKIAHMPTYYRDVRAVNSNE